ncbi:hypothetical protein FAM09_24710 [Niastella caeni]|uniref:Uncharacterized protein n=1 Tax=Niastella caeni TaxID=2569763 RepID=A0A4S8HGX0_9BACT|nr:hypothetical protein [Niastella caeni]THU34223.1 hypothetical protein FAM09_24710 [Niastella caeni]
MKKIKTFEGACKVLGHDPIKVLPKVSSFPKAHQKALIATAKLIIINEALNFVDNGKKKWVPDWNNTSEWKYYPWFWMDKPGFRLLGCYYDYSHTNVGARLVYRTRSLAEYAGKQFAALYKDLMVL